jgi:GTP pyrophosphokinase
MNDPQEIMTPLLGERFDRALLYAAQLHRCQIRKGSPTPYLAHLMSVAALVLEHGGDEDQAIAALLHDAIEDQGGASTREEIRGQFGDRVVAIVDGCTDAETTPKPPWRRRKEEHIERIASAPPEVLIVIAADKLHNVRSMIIDYRRLGPELWSRFTGRRDGTFWYYRAVAAAVRPNGPALLVDELERAIEELAAEERKK